MLCRKTVPSLEPQVHLVRWPDTQVGVTNKPACVTIVLKAGELIMAHWRKSYPQTTQLDSRAIWAVGVSMLAVALMFIVRHVYT